MMNKFLYGITILLCTMSFAQMQDYTYKSELKGVEKQWHRVQLPNTMFGSVQKSLEDIRIYGITQANDTIEAPYMLQQLKDEKETVIVPFETQNQVHNANGYYYTFKSDNKSEMNQLSLNFNQNNFDWKVTLTASHDQKEWFTVVEDYRIVAIKNDLVSYVFTNVVFPKSNYPYYRVLVKTDENPKLTQATFKLNTVKKGNLQKFAIQNSSMENDKQHKKTVAHIMLDTILPINKLKVNIANTTDYYRRYTLSYRSHRFKTEKGWKETYTKIKSGVLHSVHDEIISFNTRMAKKLKLEIFNQDNTPLKISSFDIKGYTYVLTARFDEKATYYLTYGNPKARAPRYDIVRFKKDIPAQLPTVVVGEAIVIAKETVAKQNPLFENKMWLWAILLVIIGLLGWFSVKMMKEK